MVEIDTGSMGVRKGDCVWLRYDIRMDPEDQELLNDVLNNLERTPTLKGRDVFPVESSDGYRLYVNVKDDTDLKTLNRFDELAKQRMDVMVNAEIDPVTRVIPVHNLPDDIPL